MLKDCLKTCLAILNFLVMAMMYNNDFRCHEIKMAAIVLGFRNICMDYFGKKLFE